MHLFTLREGNNTAKRCTLKNMHCLMECIWIMYLPENNTFQRGNACCSNCSPHPTCVMQLWHCLQRNMDHISAHARPLPNGNGWWQMILTKDVPTLGKHQVLDRPCCQAGPSSAKYPVYQAELSLESTRMTAVLWTPVLKASSGGCFGKDIWKRILKYKQRLKESTHCKWMHRAEGLVWSFPSCLYFSKKRKKS